MNTSRAEWVKSEDAGYSAGRLLLDGPGGHWSVYRARSRWVCAWIEGQICRSHTTHRTRREAMAHAESGGVAPAEGE